MKKIKNQFIIFASVLALVTVVIIIIYKDFQATEEVGNFQKSKFSAESLNSIEGVYLTDIEYMQDDRLVGCTLKNNTNDTIYYGEQFFLEKQINGEWYEIPYSYKIPWTYQLNYLEPSTCTEISVQIDIWMLLQKGNYRLIKEVFLSERLSDVYPISSPNFKLK